MSQAITFRASLGGIERDFALTGDVLPELEAATETGIGSLFSRLASREYRFGDLIHTIRLALEGAGETSKDAARLVKHHVENRPLLEAYDLATGILSARLIGQDDAEPDTAADEPPPPIEHATEAATPSVPDIGSE